MQRILRSLRLGPHRVDVVEIVDGDGGGYTLVTIDGAVVTDPLIHTPTTEELLGRYARWKTGPRPR